MKLSRNGELNRLKWRDLNGQTKKLLYIIGFRFDTYYLLILKNKINIVILLLSMKYEDKYYEK